MYIILREIQINELGTVVARNVSSKIPFWHCCAYFKQFLIRNFILKIIHCVNFELICIFMQILEYISLIYLDAMALNDKKNFYTSWQLNNLQNAVEFRKLNLKGPIPSLKKMR